MNSSGMKRGFAAVAVSALAVAGAPFLASTASAVPLDNQTGGGADSVVLANPEPFVANNISAKDDGQNNTFKLQAVAGGDIVNVRFEYSLNGGTTWIPVATVPRNDNGSFGYEWDLAGVSGGSVTNRAVGLTSVGVEHPSAPSTNTVDNSLKTTNINNGDSIGVFQAPYAGEGVTAQDVIFSGTSSDASSVYTYSWHDGSWTPENMVPTSLVGGKNVWKAAVDISGYTYGAGDELLLGAENGTPADGSGDSEAYTLYKQAISTVTAVAADTNIPAGHTTEVTVTVTDGTGKAIAGAQVFSSNGGAPGYTDANGQVVFDQGPGAAYYYANATDENAFSPELGDKKSDAVTVTQYTAGPHALVASSRDGAAFDINEYDAADLTVQVVDQDDDPFDTTGQSLTYHWVRTPFAGGVAQRYPASGETTLGAETDGEFTVPLPDTAAGTYELFAGLAADSLGNGAIAQSSVLTVKTGQAAFVFDESSPEQAAVGGDEEIGVTLELADGTGLPGRPVRFARTAGANALFNQATGPDANPYDTVTNAAGHASAVLDDPNADTTREDTTVDLSTLNWVHSGDTDNAAASGSQDVDFLVSVTPAHVTLSDDGGDDRPGTLHTFQIYVQAANMDALSNADVTVTTDHGYFTDGIPQGAAGAEAGVYDNDGQQVTVKTNGSGYAHVKLSMGRDDAFDDDGEVTSSVEATAGTASDAYDFDWSSYDPLNPGDIDVFFSASHQDSSVLPKAPFQSDDVCLDVTATDQFGNETEVHPVFSDDTALAGFTADYWTDFNEDNCDVVASATDEVDQEVTADWTNTTTVLDANHAIVDGPDVTTSDAETIEWYAVDYGDSSYMLDHPGADKVAVGTTVTMKYSAEDQFGEPIANMWVQFFRAGPDTLQDGSGAYDGVLGQDGSIQYVFAGTKAGTATVTAIGRHNSETGDVIPQAEETATVSFGKEALVATLSGDDNGKKDDVLKVSADKSAAGAKVILYKVVGGDRVKVASDKLNDNGDRKFTVNDKNGKKVTKYVAVVKPTDLTKSDTTNTKKVR